MSPLSQVAADDRTVAEHDRKYEEEIWLAKQPPGVRRFIEAMRAANQDDALDGPQPVIPGILSEGQTAIFPGAPGTGKTFAIMDMLARVSMDVDFLGKPVLSGGTIYVTGEGQAGLSKRIAALTNKFDIKPTSPFLYVRTMPRLLEPDQVRDFVTAIKFKIERWEVPIRIIAFDTLNRAIVGGSENEGKDIAKLFDADNRIKDAFECASIYAHHPGKAEGNDTRGHSSLLGDSDVVAIFTGKTGMRTMEVKKQKDDADGQVFGYTLRQVHLGMHKISGDAVTSCVVDWAESGSAQAARSAKTSWPKGLTQLYDALTAAVIDCGQDHRVASDGPVVRAVGVDAVRLIHRTRYVHSGDGDRDEAVRKAFSRNLKAATDNRLITAELVKGQQLLWSTRAA